MTDTALSIADVLGDDVIGAAARHLFDSRSHPLLERGGHSTEWDGQTKRFRASEMRVLRAAMREGLKAINHSEVCDE